ncbi:MAG: metal-dependent transcriptional regulator [Anaerolineales bacterium]
MEDLKMSESEEMYLITLAKLAERGVEGPVPLSRLATELSVVPVSANQMVHKLQEEGLLDYQPYKGVALQPEGRRHANRTLRRRRLWELFLVEQLDLGFAEADALACRFEHLGADEVTERLAGFLGHPQTSPQGLPIPAVEEAGPIIEQPLTHQKAGRRYQIVKIADETLRHFLDSQGISEGKQVSLLATSSRGDVLVETTGDRTELTGAIAEQILAVELID